MKLHKKTKRQGNPLPSFLLLISQLILALSKLSIARMSPTSIKIERIPQSRPKENFITFSPTKYPLEASTA